MSPLALSNISALKQKNNANDCIIQTPVTCPNKKLFVIEKEDTTTKCSSILWDNEILKQDKNKKFFKRAYECEDVYPVKTLEDDHDVLLIKAKKRFSLFEKKFKSFTIIKDDKDTSLQGRTILQILRQKSIADSSYSQEPEF